MVAYSDADWAGCPDTRRSTTGFCHYLGPNLTSWSAKKQPTVSRSSAEAEYRALAYTCADTIYVHHLLRDLGISLSTPIIIYCDNLSATYMEANPVFHARSKHIELDYHFVRERVAKGTYKVAFVSTQNQIADIFTKGLSRLRFDVLRSKLVNLLPCLRGSINRKS